MAPFPAKYVIYMYYIVYQIFQIIEYIEYDVSHLHATNVAN